MALTQNQKATCFQLVQLAIPIMTDAEYLASTIRIAGSYAAATDPLATSVIMIADIKAFRAANPDLVGQYSGPAGSYVSETNAQALARLG